MDERTFHQEKIKQFQVLILITDDEKEQATLRMILAKHEQRLDELK